MVATNDDFRNSLWKNFLKKINWKEQIEFAEVMKVLQNRLGQVSLSDFYDASRWD